MTEIIRFVNDIIQSNTYIIIDRGHCVIIDPGSEHSSNEIAFITSKGLSLDYIILTHEHTDHTWGVNSLLINIPGAKVICSESCKRSLPTSNKSFFSLYLNDSSMNYCVERVDLTTDRLDNFLLWCGNRIEFIPTPGHTDGSICIRMGNVVFTGDTLIPNCKTVTKLKGGSKEKLIISMERLKGLKGSGMVAFPGHKDPFDLDSYELNNAF